MATLVPVTNLLAVDANAIVLHGGYCCFPVTGGVDIYTYNAAGALALYGNIAGIPAVNVNHAIVIGNYVAVSDWNNMRLYLYDLAGLALQDTYNFLSRPFELADFNGYLVAVGLDYVRVFNIAGGTFVMLDEDFDATYINESCCIHNNSIIVADEFFYITAYSFDGTTLRKLSNSTPYLNDGTLVVINDCWSDGNYIYCSTLTNDLLVYTFDPDPDFTDFTASSEASPSYGRAPLSVGFKGNAASFRWVNPEYFTKVFEDSVNNLTGFGVYGNEGNVVTATGLAGMVNGTFNGTAYTQVSNVAVPSYAVGGAGSVVVVDYNPNVTSYLMT